MMVFEITVAIIQFLNLSKFILISDANITEKENITCFVIPGKQ